MKKISSFMTELLPCGARWEYEGHLAHRYYRPASTACLLAECDPAFARHWPVAAAGLRSEVVRVSVAARAAALIVAFLGVVGLGIFVAVYYVGAATTQLPIVHYTASGGQVNVVLQELRPGPGNQAVAAHHTVLGPGQHEGQRDHLRL
jgi:hypothetical protein